MKAIRSCSPIFAMTLVLGAVLLLAGCAPKGPDLGPFASAIKWLGVCLVLSSLIWAIGIFMFGHTRK